MDNEMIFNNMLVKEVKRIKCPNCGNDVVVAFGSVYDEHSKYTAFQVQQKFIKDLQEHNTLYLRDTSKFFRASHPWCTEIIRVLVWSDKTHSYINTTENGRKNIFNTNYLFQLIKGKGVEEGLEIIGIYGNVAK